MANNEEGKHRLRPSGGYRNLHSFQVTTVIYDGTVSFCKRFMDPRSRTVDQMVQAARSGRQNIAEGSRASATSSQTELRLVSVARASLDELLLDYEDYLRQNGHVQWDKDSAEALAVRNVGREMVNRNDCERPEVQLAIYRPWLEHPDPAVVANALICLIHQANYLLDRQIGALEKQFVNGGGYSELLARARLEERKRGNLSDRTIQSESEKILTCPRCGATMVLRTARTGTHSGMQFWGCSKYPECKGTVPV
jgi:restriction system protein